MMYRRFLLLFCFGAFVVLLMSVSPTIQLEETSGPVDWTAFDLIGEDDINWEEICQHWPKDDYPANFPHSLRQSYLYVGNSVEGNLSSTEFEDLLLINLQEVPRVSSFLVPIRMPSQKKFYIARSQIEQEVDVSSDTPHNITVWLAAREYVVTYDGSDSIESFTQVNYRVHMVMRFPDDSIAQVDLAKTIYNVPECMPDPPPPPSIEPQAPASGGLTRLRTI